MNMQLVGCEMWLGDLSSGSPNRVRSFKRSCFSVTMAISHVAYGVGSVATLFQTLRLCKFWHTPSIRFVLTLEPTPQIRVSDIFPNLRTTGEHSLRCVVSKSPSQSEDPPLIVKQYVNRL
jgi:hypothetical protein